MCSRTPKEGARSARAFLNVERPIRGRLDVRPRRSTAAVRLAAARAARLDPPPSPGGHYPIKHGAYEGYAPGLALTQLLPTGLVCHVSGGAYIGAEVRDIRSMSLK